MLACLTNQRGNRMQKGKTVLLILALSFGIIGCGQDKAPDVSSVSIGKEGKIVHQIVGDFDQNYYEMEGLKSLAADRVAEYCADNGADSVTLGSVEEKDGRILIQFNYATDQDYSEFNHRDLFVGTIAEAMEKGYPLESVPFVSSAGEAIEIGFMDNYETKQIAIIATKPSEELVVNIYGKVLYINRGSSETDVSFSGKKDVHITHPANENTDESVLSYIVFE